MPGTKFLGEGDVLCCPGEHFEVSWGRGVRYVDSFSQCSGWLERPRAFRAQRGGLGWGYTQINQEGLFPDADPAPTSPSSPSVYHSLPQPSIPAHLFHLKHKSSYLPVLTHLVLDLQGTSSPALPPPPSCCRSSRCLPPVHLTFQPDRSPLGRDGSSQQLFLQGTWPYFLLSFGRARWVSH